MVTASKCSREGCGIEQVKLKCPICLKNGMDSFYCSQECFKLDWGVHKAKHAAANTVAEYDPFPRFKYTGGLRAIYPLSARRKVPEHIRPPDYHLT
ncbi:Methionine aminopeptidase 1, partial [Zancudomyces culisetae]